MTDSSAVWALSMGGKHPMAVHATGKGNMKARYNMTKAPTPHEQPPPFDKSAGMHEKCIRRYHERSLL